MTEKSKKPRKRKQLYIIILLCSFLLVMVITLSFLGPIPQNPAYHSFADQRIILGIPHFFNVVSNLPFLLIGSIGLLFCRTGQPFSNYYESKPTYFIFFLGVLLIGIGSAHYHLNPNNWGLFWDRLAMAICFMGFFSLLLGEFFGHAAGRKMLLPLLLYGAGSVIYWIITEQSGNGDIRPYVITQFLPLFCIPLALFIRRETEMFTNQDLLLIGTGYILAKCFEAGDHALFSSLSINGHTLKHLAASCSAGWMLVIITRKSHISR